MFVFWLVIVGWNLGFFLTVPPRSSGAQYYAAAGVFVLVLVAVRAFLTKATISLRGDALRVTVGPVAPGTSSEIPLDDIDGFEIESTPRRPSTVVVRRRSGTRAALRLPLDGVMIGPRGSANVWFGTAPASHHELIVAWLEKALAKARRHAMGTSDPSARPSQAG